ncbi:hypothetical protein BCR35DRAFT_270103 [Leucosporidium creatinivorum]|uniref:GAF domain-containing protein n=1 Tax=Leucosporidium creatinivorum TaxID=106004 RepID=A0A1Y2E675_9BASI|nr:hypothetical protein BCR35DRAFT_270103 [Leucosporidium creatinivorum]
MLSAFGLKSSSRSNSKGVPAHVQAVSNAAVIADIQQRERVANSARIKAAAEQLREQGRKVMRAVKKKISSKSPKEEHPSTWDEYVKRYINAEIDVEDPPLPPARPADMPADQATAFEQRCFMPPKPYNEIERQAMVNKLDLLGTKRLAAKSSEATLAIKLPAKAEGALSSPMYANPSNSSAHSHASSRESLLLRRDSLAETASLAPSTRTQQTVHSIHAEAVESIKDNVVFKAIISKCKDIFDSKVSMLTVLDDEQQLFLCTGGMELGDSLPRSVTFCAHAIMDDENQGMVVLDAKEDWRFANGVPATHLGARFYAGVPLLAPNFGNPDAPAIPIGTLCVADDRPREGFTPEQRMVLFDLAAQASKEVENWCNARMEGKLNRLEDVFHATSLGPESNGFKSSITDLDTPPMTPPANFNDSESRSKMALAPPAPNAALPATPPHSVHQHHQSRSSHSREGSFSDASIASSSRRGSDTPSAQGSSLRPGRRPSTATGLSLAMTSEAPVTAVPKDLQRVFDQATKMLAKALGVSLVYLVALDLLPSSSSSSPTLRVLAAHGLSNPAPSFDPALHLKALRAPEGGLLYRNPRYSPEGEGLGFASGMLIPILEVRRVGYCLCAYTKEAERQFEQKDLALMVKFAEQLETYVTKLGRTNSQVSLRA